MTESSISARELESMLLDIDVPDAQIRPFLIDSVEDSTPLNPVVKANPARVADVSPLEAAVALASLNGISRWRRHRRYLRKIDGWKGLRIVSEGDSWFQYPLLLDDVIDHLFDRYAILSLDAAGDLMADIMRQNELVAAVAQERPDVVLLSGGGNDVLSGARLSSLLPPYAEGRKAQAYLGPEFEANLKSVARDYDTLVGRVLAVRPGVRVICHTYDYVLPANSRWLGRPLAKIGIRDAALQCAILRCIVDRFHTVLSEIAAGHQDVQVVDCRGVVGNRRWHDELHPTSAGYGAVAACFIPAIEGKPGLASTGEAAGADVNVEAAVPPPSLFEQAKAQLATYSEPILLREIGRRKTLAAAGDPATDDDLLVYGTSVEAVFPEQQTVGAKLADETVRIMLEDERNPQSTQAPDAAMRLGAQAGLPPEAAAMLAAVAVARLDRTRQARSGTT